MIKWHTYTSVIGLPEYSSPTIMGGESICTTSIGVCKMCDKALSFKAKTI